MITSIQNSETILFLKTLSSDVLATLKEEAISTEPADPRVVSIVSRSIGGLIALYAVPLAAKTVVLMATGEFAISTVGLITTLFLVVLAHDLIQMGYNLRPDGLIKELERIWSDENALHDTIVFHPLIVALGDKL